MELSTGRVVDRRYTVRGLLGSGGMANVYAARDERLGIDVALKVLSLPAASIQDRLVQEGRVQAALKHPNVLSVTDIVDIDGCPGLVMELVTGLPLDELIVECPPDVVEAETLARGIIAGVRAAHELGLVHRDLKPANVLVARVGDALLPKVADFGLVKLLDDSATGTRSGATLGTPRYMAPEQVRDSKSVDLRADIFSLGAILYELFAGRPAFAAADTFEVFSAIVEGRYVPLSKMEGLPARIVAAVEGCLQPDLDARIASTSALLAVLDGDSGPPRERWRPALLQAVSAYGAKLDAADLRVNSDTWLDSVGPDAPSLAGDLEPLASAPVDHSGGDTLAPSEPSTSSSRPLWLAVVFAALLVAGGLSFLRPGELPAFSLDGAPPVAEASTQRLLDRAWAEYEANEDQLAMTHVQQALEQGAEDPELYLLAAALDLSFWDFDGFARYVHSGAAAAGNERGAVASLLRTLDSQYASHEDLSWWGPTFSAHVATYPDDRLAKYMWGLGMAYIPEHVSFDEDLVNGLVDSRPAAVAPWVLKIELLSAHGRLEEALAITDQALAQHPRSAALHAGKATRGLVAGDHQMAIDEGNAALRIDPGYWHGRLMASIGALALGRRDEYERLIAPMIGDETPPDQVHRFAVYMARVLASFGQMRESDEWWVRYEDAAEAVGDRTFVLIGRADQVTQNSFAWMATDQALELRLRRLDAAVADPTIASAARRAPGLVSLFAHGVLDARAGRLADARVAMSRLETAKSALAGRLGAEIDAAAGDVEGLSSLEGDCFTFVARGMALLELAQHDAAGRAFAATAATCDGHDTLPFALAAAGQVLIARESGDARAAAAALQTLDEGWRDPDADLPIVRRLAATAPQ